MEENEEYEELRCFLKCRRIRIGSYQICPLGSITSVDVLLMENSLSFSAPITSDQNKLVRITLGYEDINKIYIHFGECLPVMFIKTTPRFGQLLRNYLGMIQNKTPFFDPSSKDITTHNLTFVFEPVTEDHSDFIRLLFFCGAEEKVFEINLKSAHEILVLSTPATPVMKRRRAFVSSPINWEELEKQQIPTPFKPTVVPVAELPCAAIGNCVKPQVSNGCTSQPVIIRPSPINCENLEKQQIPPPFTPTVVPVAKLSCAAIGNCMKPQVGNSCTSQPVIIRPSPINCENLEKQQIPPPFTPTVVPVAELPCEPIRNCVKPQVSNSGISQMPITTLQSKPVAGILSPVPFPQLTSPLPSLPPPSAPSPKLLLPPPPYTINLSKEVIVITENDFHSLDKEEYLNDTIIDFYLKYLLDEELSPYATKRTHIFNTFFYTSLTNIPQTADNDMAIQMRYQRVKRWTKKKDIFDEDFIIIPVNQISHWFLAIINYAKLANNSENSMESSPFDSMDVDSTTNPDRKQLGKNMPCICIFDSYLNYENGQLRGKTVGTILREYLQQEWNAKKVEEKKFTAESLPTLIRACPQQRNIHDCGLYLLQYVESFFAVPVHIHPPWKNLTYLFTKETIDKKRQQLQDLILNLNEKSKLKAGTASCSNESSLANH